MNKILQKLVFILRFRYYSRIISVFRKIYFSSLGMKIGSNTKLPAIKVTWPHQVVIGDNCELEPEISFKYASFWKPGPSILLGHNVYIGAGCEFNILKNITVGNNTMITLGCKFIEGYFISVFLLQIKNYV